MKTLVTLITLGSLAGPVAAQQLAQEQLAPRPPATPIQACNSGLSLEAVPAFPTLPVVRLRDVVALAASDVWAVGSGSNSTQALSVTMHFDGKSWTQVASPSPPGVGSTSVSLESVAAVSPDEVYAAGYRQGAVNNASDNFALRWDGLSWQDLQAPGQSQFGASGYLFEAVEAVGHHDVWFGGQWQAATPTASMVHYDGSGFDVYLLPLAPNATNAAHRIRAISALAANDVWAAGSAGGNAVAVGQSYVAHWNGSNWQHVPTPHPGFSEILTAVVALKSDDVWVSGSTRVLQGTNYVQVPLFLHWDGSGWTEHFSPAYAHALVAIAPGLIYGASADKLVRWNGFTWTIEDSFSNPLRVLYGVDALGPCDLVLVGTTYFNTQDNDPLVARYR